MTCIYIHIHILNIDTWNSTSSFRVWSCCLLLWQFLPKFHSICKSITTLCMYACILRMYVCIVIWDGALWFWSVIKITMTVCMPAKVCMQHACVRLYIFSFRNVWAWAWSKYVCSSSDTHAHVYETTTFLVRMQLCMYRVWHRCDRHANGQTERYICMSKWIYAWQTDNETDIVIWDGALWFWSVIKQLWLRQTDSETCRQWDR